VFLVLRLIAPDLKEVSFTGIADQGGLIEIERTPDLIGGELVEGDATAFLDTGFANIGVRPTNAIGTTKIESARPARIPKPTVVCL